jgi:hypothetical protein
MVDRLKLDEARLKGLQGAGGLTQAQIDSLALLGPRLSDSIRRAVARELQAAGVEPERNRGSVSVEVAPPAAPAPAAPAKP